MLYKEWLNEWLELYIKASTKERTYMKYRHDENAKLGKGYPLAETYRRRVETTQKANGSAVCSGGKSEYGAQIRAYQCSFELVLRKLHIERKGFHALRHTFATRALEVGMDVKTLSEILGHRNPTITLNRYSHSLLEHKTEMMNKVGRLFG